MTVETIDIPAGEVGYELGRSVYIDAVLQQKADALWVPPQVIRTYEGRQFIIIQENGVQRRVDVTVGIKGEDHVKILDGLSEGQIVVSP